MTRLAPDTQQRSAVITLGRPRIEAELGTGGWLTILPNGHAWLAGSRRQALREFAELERIEQWGCT
jgi:hypothetical protein